MVASYHGTFKHDHDHKDFPHNFISTQVFNKILSMSVLSSQAGSENRTQDITKSYPIKQNAESGILGGRVEFFYGGYHEYMK